MFSIQAGASLAKGLFIELGPAGVTLLRIFFASLILIAIYRPWRTKLSSSQYKAIALYGFSLGAMNLSFYMALERIPLGITVALEFSGPLAVALFSSKQLKDIVWVICAVVGIYLLLPLGATSANLDSLGIFFALLAGAFWGMYILFGEKVASSVPSGTASSLGMVIALVTVLPYGLLANGSNLLQWNLIPIAFGVAILSSAIPYTLEMISLQKIPKQSFSIMMSLEPAIATLSGFVLLKEQLHPTQYLAIALIITASVGSIFTNVKNPVKTKN